MGCIFLTPCMKDECICTKNVCVNLCRLARIVFFKESFNIFCGMLTNGIYNFHCNKTKTSLKKQAPCNYAWLWVFTAYYMSVLYYVKSSKHPNFTIAFNAIAWLNLLALTKAFSPKHEILLVCNLHGWDFWHIIALLIIVQLHS